MPLTAKLLVGILISTAVVAIYWRLQTNESNVSMRANVADIQQILSEDLEQVLEKISVAPAEVSLPTDGKGARMLVRVKKGMSAQVPSEIVINRNSREITVQIEVDESYESFSAQ